MDLLVALGGVVAALIFAMFRSEEESMPLLFCLGYQWLFIVAGITYRGFYGKYPSDYFSENIDESVVTLLCAFLTMAAGIWTALRMWTRVPRWQRKRAMLSERSNFSSSRLFKWIILLYAVSWISTGNPKQVAYSVSQILYRLLEFRSAFLFLLFLVVFRRQRGRASAVLAGLFVMLPLVTGGGAGFASVLLVLLLAALTERRSLLDHGLSNFRNRRTFFTVCAVGFVLANLAIMWEGAIKSEWRPIARSAQNQASRFDRIRMFFIVASESVGDLDWNKGLESLARRTSDVPMLMALVWDRVPTLVPHEAGGLTARAVKHVTMPRFLFPDKTDLGSDSWLVSKYAGLNVAGEAQGTSIGLGYLIEFYIDYGTIGMLMAAFVFGAFLGSMHRILLLTSPSMDLYRGTAAAILLQHFFSLDGNLAKIVGGLITSYVVLGALLLLVGAKLHRSLLFRPVENRSDGVAANAF